MVKCQVILDALERIAPRHLAEEWDNPGLLVGSPAQEVNRILVALDVSDHVVHQALEQGAQMIIAHHPLIFRPLKKLRTDLPLGHRLSVLLKHDIAVAAAHTNLDIAQGASMMYWRRPSDFPSSRALSSPRSMRMARWRAWGALAACHRL